MSATVTLVVTNTDILGVEKNRTVAMNKAQEYTRATGIDTQVIDWIPGENKQFNMPLGEWL